VSINAPRFTSNPPQLHHKNTIKKTLFSQKPPEKTRFHHTQKKAARQKSRTALSLIRVPPRASAVDRLYIIA
jgi:hypothetical protein